MPEDGTAALAVMSADEHVEALEKEMLSTPAAVEHLSAAKETLDRETDATREALRGAMERSEAQRRVESLIAQWQRLYNAALMVTERADNRNAALVKIEWNAMRMKLPEVRVNPDVGRRFRRFVAVRQSHRAEETASHVMLGKIKHAVKRGLVEAFNVGKAPLLRTAAEGEDGRFIGAVLEAAEVFGCRIDQADAERFLYDQTTAGDEAGERLRNAFRETEEGIRVYQSLRDYKEQFHPERVIAAVSPFHAGFRLHEISAGQEVALPAVGIVEALRREQRGKTVSLAMNTGTRLVFYIDEDGMPYMIEGRTPYEGLSPLEALEKEGKPDEMSIPSASPVRASTYDVRETMRRLEEVPDGTQVRLRARVRADKVEQMTLIRREGKWEYAGTPPEGAPAAADLLKDPRAFDPHIFPVLSA